MTLDPDGEEALQPRAGCWVLILPVLAAAVIVVGYGAVLILGSRGRVADGALARLAFTGCAEAKAPVLARLDAMGIAASDIADAPDGFAFTVRLPSDPGAAAEIPVTLATPAAFTIRLGPDADGEVVAGSDAVEAATLRLDFTVSALAAVHLSSAAESALKSAAESEAAEIVSFWLDGVPMGTRKLDPRAAWDRLDLEPRTGDREASIRRAAEWALLVDAGPLPCPVEVETTPIE